MPSFANRLRTAIARRFLVRIKRASHRMPVELVAPVAGRILVIAPHMDDEAIACGGTLLLHKALRSELRVVFVSDSSSAVSDPVIADRMRAIRRAEMLQVRDALAIGGVAELGFPDGSLVQHEAAIAARLADELRTFAPTQVFCPFPVDGHADHQACALAFGAATALAGWQGEVIGYEVWSPLWANIAVDIGAVAEQKAALIRLYASQIADRDYASAVLGLNQYRGLQHRVAFAEAFHRCTPAQFRELTDCLNRLG
ncbi:MAG: PIG-L deacetylase family protein [Burkholderiales bacterium]